MFENNDYKIIHYDEIYLKQIVNLFTNTIHKTCNNDYTKEQLNAWANPKIDYNLWIKRCNKTKPYLVLFNNELIAFSELRKNYIDCFYIHHNYQKRGIGKILLNYMINIAKEKNIKILKIDSSITAKFFFKKFGFVIVKKNIINRNDEELINFRMELKL